MIFVIFVEGERKKKNYRRQMNDWRFETISVLRIKIIKSLFNIHLNAGKIYGQMITKTQLLFLIFFGWQILVYAQEDSGIFIFDIERSEDAVEFSNLVEIPHQKGYNNQPFFISDDEILFSSENNGQADIAKFRISTGKIQWMHPETAGGEYSPQPIPDSENIAAVRLDPDGLQRLYEYDIKNKTASLIIPDIQVAYFTFMDHENILATVLNKESMDLVTIDLNLKKTDTLSSRAGRSISKVPNTSLVSYTLYNENNQLDLYTYDFTTDESVFICELPYNVQDYIWLTDSLILTGSGYRLFLYDTWSELEWISAGTIEKYGISQITRMALSPNGKKLAVTGTKKP